MKMSLSEKKQNVFKLVVRSAMIYRVETVAMFKGQIVEPEEIFLSSNKDGQNWGRVDQRGSSG